MRVVLLTLLLIGALGTAGADAQLFDYTSLPYIVADNLLLLSVTFSVGLGVLPQGVSTTRKFAVRTGLVTVVISVVTVTVFLASRTPLTTYRLLLIAALGISVGTSTALILRNPEQKVSSQVIAPLPWIYLALGLWVVVTAVLQGLVPGTPVLTWLLALPTLILIPGFSLASALLPAGTSWIQHLVYAIPLSLGVYLISLAWLIQLSIAVTPMVFFAIALVAIASGFGLSIFTRQSAAAEK